MLLVSFTAGDLAMIRGYMEELIGDFLPLIVIVLGIGVGLWVLERLLFKR